MIPPPELVNITLTTAACAARLAAIRPKAAASVAVALVALRKKLAKLTRVDAVSAGRASAGSVLGCVFKWNLPRLVVNKDATTPVCWLEFGVVHGLMCNSNIYATDRQAP